MAYDYIGPNGAIVTSAGSGNYFLPYGDIVTDVSDEAAGGPQVNLTSAACTQLATSSTVVITVTPPVVGTVNLAGASTSQSATSGTGIITVSAASGTITLVGLKNNTATAHASLTGITVYVYSVVTGALVVAKTGQTTNGSGDMTINDAAITAGTTYRCVIVLAAGGEGLARAVAA